MKVYVVLSFWNYDGGFGATTEGLYRTMEEAQAKLEKLIENNHDFYGNDAVSLEEAEKNGGIVEERTETMWTRYSYDDIAGDNLTIQIEEKEME